MDYFIVFDEEVIYFMSGENYTSSIVPMQIIMPTLLFIGITNILGMQILVPLGYENIVLYSEVAGAITDLVLNWILIPHYGAAGAAAGTLAAELVVLLIQAGCLGKRIWYAFRSVHYLRILAGTGLGVMGSLWVKNLSLTYFLMMVLSAALFFGIYFIFMIVMKEELILELIDSLKR